MNVCQSLRGFALRHEWASVAFAALGIGLLGGAVWGVLFYHQPMLEWIQLNPLLHGLAAGIGSVAGLAIAFGSLCLGFSECSDSERNCMRVRGKRLFSGGLKFIDSLGSNPKHTEKRRYSHR